MAFRKIKGSFKNRDITTHVLEDTYLAHDTVTGQLRIGDGVTPGGSLVAGGSATGLKFGDTTSATISISDGGVLNLVGTGGVTATVAGDTLTIDGSGVSGGGGTTLFVADDSATVEIASGGSLYIRGGEGITTSANSDGTITITSSGTADLGELQISGSKLSVQDSSTVGVGIENIRIAGNTFSIDDSAVGFEFDGHLIPSENGTYDLGSDSKRWKTAFLSSETLDIGGATISSDGTGTLSISATGATLPEDSKVGTNKIQPLGATSGTGGRPIQRVKIFVSDGSTSFTDAQLLAKTADLVLEFNATIDTEPVYTQAQQTFTLANGDNLASRDAVTLFQF